MWCLVENELLEGANIKECYYGCPMQSLIRRQHPDLFGIQKDDCSEKTKPLRDPRFELLSTKLISLNAVLLFLFVYVFINL